jgi:hypothetical protein
MESTSMTSMYMSFSPKLVNERNNALNNCPTKSGRCQIYKTYYFKMKDAYEKNEADQDEADQEVPHQDDADQDEADQDEDDEDEDDEDYEPSEDEEYDEEYEEDEEEEYDEEYEEEEYDEEEYAGEAEASEEEAGEEEYDAEAYEEDKNEFGCPGCNYEWRDGYKNGWKDAMKYIAIKIHKEVPPTPACSYCDIVCKTRKCGGKCEGMVRYCSVECQKQDWAFGHKNICGK